MGINCAKKKDNQKNNLYEIMNDDPKYGAMHQSSVKSFHRMFLSSWLLSKENIVSKDCIKEDNKGVGEEDQDCEEDVVQFPVEVVVFPMKLKSTDFLPKIVLIVRMANQVFVIVPQSNVPCFHALSVNLRILSRTRRIIQKHFNIFYCCCVI